MAFARLPEEAAADPCGSVFAVHRGDVPAARLQPRRRRRVRRTFRAPPHWPSQGWAAEA